MDAQFSQISLGALRRDLALSKRNRASAAQQNDRDRMDDEGRRVHWLELHIAYLEELTAHHDERQ